MTECLSIWGLVQNLYSQQNSCDSLYETVLSITHYSFTEYIPFYLKTFFLELPIYYFFLRHFKPASKIILLTAVINLATHPFIFLVLPNLFSKYSLTYLPYLLTAETFAPLVEAGLLIYFKVSWRTAMMASISANLVSWTIGLYWL
jgi:hypothetical protein